MLVGCEVSINHNDNDYLDTICASLHRNLPLNQGEFYSLLEQLQLPGWNMNYEIIKCQKLNQKSQKYNEKEKD